VNERTWENIMNNAIAKAEEVRCSPSEFKYGLEIMRDRRQVEPSPTHVRRTPR
jgi:hypothetical protein